MDVDMNSNRDAQSSDQVTARATWTKGVIKTDDGIVVASPMMTLRRLQSNGVKTTEVRPTGPGFCSVGCGPFMLDGEEFVATVYFRDWVFCKKIVLFNFALSIAATVKVFGKERPGSDVEFPYYENLYKKHVGHTRCAVCWWGSMGPALDHWTLESSIAFNYFG